MKKSLISLLAAAMALTGVAANVQRTPHGIKAQCSDIDIEITFVNPATVRVLKAPAGTNYIVNSLAVIEQPSDTRLQVSDMGSKVVVTSSDLRVQLNTATGAVSFYTPGKKLLTAETGLGTFEPTDDGGMPAYDVAQSFTVDANEAIYGLGILQNGKMSQRGENRLLKQANTDNVVTMYQSVKGYGIYWDNYSPTWFRDNGSSLTFDSEIGDCIDYYFMYGGDNNGVIALMRQLTGDVPMIPMWGYGYLQSKERYDSHRELMEVVRRYREAQVPIDGIIQDWQYWTHNYLWNAMDFLSDGFRNPKAMIDDLHGQNVHMLISVWPDFGPMTKPYAELDSAGHLFPMRTFPTDGATSHITGEAYPSHTKIYDAFSPEARDIYWKHLNRLHDVGIEGWWLDSTEPEEFGTGPEMRQVRTGLGSYERWRNAYPLMTVEGVYDHQRADTDTARVFILTRCSFAGQQRTGANVWSGDVDSNWPSLRKQLTAGLNFTMTGNPNYNSDGGGFWAAAYNRHGGDAPKYADFKELYTRWIQLNAFNPMMRSHGTQAPREIYQFGQKGEPVYDAIESAIRLRYQMLPYIYSTAWQVTSERESFMRPLVMDFAKDGKTWDMQDEFMFGRSLLVAPILVEQYTQKGDDTADFTAVHDFEVYLPKGAQWWDFYTGRKYSGGQDVKLKTTIASIPLFVKAGSILPIGPDVQYTSEKPWDALEIRVYPGANGQFSLYEDEGNSYNYEKGMYTEIPMTWSDSSRTLTIGERKGSYPGMIESRTFTVVLPDSKQKTVDYDGAKVTVKL